MSSPTRLRGNIKPVFTIKLGAAAAVSYADDIKTAAMSHSDKSDSDLTFAEAAAGAAFDTDFKCKLVPSYEATTLFQFLMENRGKDVTVTWGPWGNAVPSATQPHFVLACRVPAPPLDTAATNDVKKSAESEVTFKGTADMTTLKA